MSSKLYTILLGGLCMLLNTAAHVNFGEHGQNIYFVFNWDNHATERSAANNENLRQRLEKNENSSITNHAENLTIQYMELLARLEKVEETNRLLVLNLPANCTDALKHNQSNGVYTLNLHHTTLRLFSVYCLRNVSVEQPWTIIQRRQDGSVDFYRGWNEYVEGFGDASGEYWLGLQKLHEMTSSQPMELWVELADHEGNTRSAFYNEFAIGDEKEGYKLKTLGKFSGDAGDSLTWHINNKFTTKDNDNDSHAPGNCAKICQGAWWYKWCADSNLNGSYYKKEYCAGVNWYAFKGATYSLAYAHMAIRPQTNNTVRQEKNTKVLTLSKELIDI